MGNKSEKSNHCYEQIKEIWHAQIRKELRLINDLLTTKIKPKQDKTHQANFMELYTLDFRQNTPTNATCPSLFNTELEHIRSRRQFDIQQTYNQLTLLNDDKLDTNTIQYTFFNIIINQEGCLKEIITSFRSTKLPSTIDQMDRVLLRFIKSFVNIVKYYYQLDTLANIGEFNFINTPNLINFVTNWIFDDKLYTTVYTIRKQAQISTNEDLHARIKKAKDKQLEGHGVSVKYCLSQTTKAYIISKISNRQDNPNPKTSNFLSQSSDNQLEYADLEIQSVEVDQLPSRPSARPINPTIFQTCPYQNAIDALDTLQFRITPHHKLKSLVSCFRCIYSAIMDYYGQFTTIPSNLSTDELIGIFSYVLSQSHLANPYTHFDIMKTYCNSIQESVEGYYLTIMEGSLEII